MGSRGGRCGRHTVSERKVSFAIQIQFGLSVRFATGRVYRCQHPGTPAHLQQRAHLPVHFERRLVTRSVGPCYLSQHRVHVKLVQGEKGTAQQFVVRSNGRTESESNPMGISRR